MRIKICRYENSNPKSILPCYFSSLTLNIIFNHILKYSQAENATNYYLKYSSIKISALNIILCILSLYFQPLTLYVYLNPTLKHRHVKISTPMQLICACLFILPPYIYYRPYLSPSMFHILFICLFISYQSLTLSISHIHTREQRNKPRRIETFDLIYSTSFSILSLSIHITNVPYITHSLFSTDISTNRVLKYLHAKISKQSLSNRIFESHIFYHQPSSIYIVTLNFHHQLSIQHLSSYQFSTNNTFAYLHLKTTRQVSPDKNSQRLLSVFDSNASKTAAPISK